MKKFKIINNWIFCKADNLQDKKLIDLPHDAMISETRIPDMVNGNATAYYPGGKYIYTKSIYGEEKYRNQKVMLEFEGVYMNSTVYLNDKEVGSRIYGYSNFFVDLSDHLLIGKDNELKVVVDNSETPNSRWYSGSGIYRPVNLWVGNKVSILPESVKVKTVCVKIPTVEISLKDILSEEDIWKNIYDNDIIVHCEVLDGERLLGQVNLTDGKATLELPTAKLWSHETPVLYTLKTELLKDNSVIDTDITAFGIREITWNAKQGLMINGNTVKLKGGCIHHDNGLLGACTYDKAELRRVKKLKSMGFNAIRYSHYPASKNLLDICDKEGIYLLDESFDQWKIPQSTYDYANVFDAEWKKDVKSMISKDYNHPSVIMYCIGNEITDVGLPFGAKIAEMLNNTYHEFDNTRPTTIAINGLIAVLAAKQAQSKEEKEKNKNVGSADVNDLVALLPKIMASITAESLEALIGECVKNVDIVGYNYGQNLYEGIHRMHPDRVILSTETFPGTMAQNWSVVNNNDYVIGDFMWTAWDYLGETGVGLPTYGTDKAPFSKPYPCLTAACGSFDLTGIPESQAYYNAVYWGAYKKPYIGVRPVNHSGEAYTLGRWRYSDAVPCWTWNDCEGKTAEIQVYSIGKEIELFKDGISVARKELNQCRADFETQYNPGMLEAVSYDENGKEIGRSRLESYSSTSILSIESEDKTIHADGEDLAYVFINIVDDNGRLKMNEDRKVTVKVEGEGTLLALGSGNPITEQSFYTDSYTSWHGRVLAIVKANEKSGNICVTASADNMETVKININAE